MKQTKAKKDAAAAKGSADIRSFWTKTNPTTAAIKPPIPKSNTVTASSSANAQRKPLQPVHVKPCDNNQLLPPDTSPVKLENAEATDIFLSTPKHAKATDVSCQLSPFDQQPHQQQEQNQTASECNIFWKTSPPLEKLKSFVKNVKPFDQEKEIRAISNLLGRVDDVPKQVTTNDMISELWSQPASSMASTSGLLTSKSPPKQFVWSTPHRPLKRSQSSSNIAEGSPCIYERRVKRQHWASMGSSLGPKPLNSLNSRSESTTTSSSGNLTQGLQKLTNLLGTLQSDSVSVKSPALVRSKTNQPVSSFVKVPTVELIGSIAESPFRKPYARSFSSMDVRTAEAMNFPIAPDFPNFSEVQAGKSSTVQSSDNMPVTHTSHEKSNMSLSFTGAEATASFVVGDNINNNLTEDFAIDDDDDEFGAFDDDIALLNACNAAEDQYNATQANIATNQIPDPVALPKTESKDLEFDEFDYSDFDEHVLNAMDMDVLDHGGLQAAAAAAVPVIEKRVKFTRWVVLEIRYEQCQMGGYFLPEKVVLLLNEANGEELIAKLRDDWYYTDIETGNYVHIIIDAGAPINPVIINNECNFVIVNPDTLISATHVADSFECLRKSVFQDMCRVSNDSNAAMVYGKLLHEIFQSCVLKRDFSVSTIEFEVEGMIRRSLEDLWSIGETELTARTHLLELVPNLQDWDMKYGRGQPIGPLDVFRTESKDKTTACVSNVLDIEEHIWSPTWGIKGNIDASLEIKTQTGRGPVVTHIMPFELKTGKSTTAVSHRAQASLYTLMMQDRYDVNVFGSILYYLKKKEMIKIPYIRDEVRGLLINRNKLASAISSRKLPPMIQNTRSCTNCYSLKTCLVYHKAVEDGDKDTAGLGSLFEENTKDFMPNHTAFFKKWESLLTKEEGDIQTSRKEVWTLGSEEREKTGSCLSGMTVVGEEDFSQDAAKVHRFTYTMKKATSVVSLISGAAASSSFLNLQLAAGDPIVISSEKGHYALAIGFLTQVDVDSVTVTVDRRLKGLPKRLRNFDIESNQVYSGIRMNSEGFIVSDSINLTDAAPAVYRIDKDEFSAGMALVRGNLTNLFIPDGDVKRRRLVVDLEPPTFRSSQPEDLALIESDPNLNIDQKNAMQKVLNANDYSLILGMPGTGKTTTIAQIIKALVSRGKSVLLTAYTHSAVDNVLLKLKSECVDFIRLGGHQRVHPDLHEFTAKIFESVEDVRRFYEQKQVVATTCLGIKHPIFTKRKFDYCIVDEASQLTLPVCLGPLRFANVFVLVGDHYQLPPLVKNHEARDAGLAVSLFRLLSETHPESVITLSHQYRMCADIMHLSNTLIYGSRLRCGSDKVAQSKLQIPNLKQGLEALHAMNESGFRQCTCHGSTVCWIEDLLSPNRRVVFIDTDCVPGGESTGAAGVNGSGNGGGSLVQNFVEAKLVGQVVQGLIMCGVVAEDIGIMSPYRAQLKLITHELKNVTGVSGGISSTQKEGGDLGAVEVLTVDKYQGRDKSCVLVSLVRSNQKKNVGDLLRDWRRLNVAFTRAKQKLIIFGSKSTLSGTLAFSEFLQIVEDKKWILTLPKDAHLFHEPIERKAGTHEFMNCKGEKREMKGHTGIKKVGLSVVRDIMNNI